MKAGIYWVLKGNVIPMGDAYLCSDGWSIHSNNARRFYEQAEANELAKLEYRRGGWRVHDVRAVRIVPTVRS